MRYSTTVLATALVAAAPSFQAAQTFGGNAVVVNNCDYPLYIWSVDSYNRSPSAQVIDANSQWTEPLRVPDEGCNCGVSLKVAKDDDINGDIVQLEYTIAQAYLSSSMAVSYDISFVDCSSSLANVASIDGYTVFSGENCPAWDQGISVAGSSSSCEAMDCAAGDFCYLDAYFEPEPASLLKVQPVRQCPNGDLDSDVIFTMCTSNSGSGSGYSSASLPSSSPAPSSSTPTPTPTPSATPSSSRAPYSSSSSPAAAASSSSALEVAAAEFAPIAASFSPAAPIITPAPAPIEAAIYTAVVYETILTTMFVDPEGDRINKDGSKWYGRRFAA